MNIAIFLIKGAPEDKTIPLREIYKPAGRRGLGWTRIDWMTGRCESSLRPFNKNIQAIYDSKVHRRLMVKFEYDSM